MTGKTVVFSFSIYKHLFFYSSSIGLHRKYLQLKRLRDEFQNRFLYWVSIRERTRRLLKDIETELSSSRRRAEQKEVRGDPPGDAPGWSPWKVLGGIAGATLLVGIAPALVAGAGAAAAAAAVAAAAAAGGAAVVAAGGGAAAAAGAAAGGAAAAASIAQVLASRRAGAVGGFAQGLPSTRAGAVGGVAIVVRQAIDKDKKSVPRTRKKSKPSRKLCS